MHLDLQYLILHVLFITLSFNSISNNTFIFLELEFKTCDLYTVIKVAATSLLLGSLKASVTGLLRQTETPLIYSSASFYFYLRGKITSMLTKKKRNKQNIWEEKKMLHKNRKGGENDLTISDAQSLTKFQRISPWNDRYIFSLLNSAATARRLLAIACGGFLSWLDQWLLLILMLCVWITCHKLLQAGFASIWSRAAAEKHLRQSWAGSKQSKTLMACFNSTKEKWANSFNGDNEEDERKHRRLGDGMPCRAS